MPKHHEGAWKQILLSGLLMAAMMGLVKRAGGQSPAWRGGEYFDFRRLVQTPLDSSEPDMVVVEFLAHGQKPTGGKTLMVFDSKGPVPCRLLQAGPGDFCRLAFQTSPRQQRYSIYYGGKGESGLESSEWTATPGLLLETRVWRDCQLDNLKSVQQAFEAAQPQGADFVSNVFHRANPYEPQLGPFLSRYQGTLKAPASGKYTFFTSSQDCSFLLIDGKAVVSAPGRHGPTGQARISGTVTLTSGPHRFEYLHAAAGTEACMVAAWQPPQATQPVPIPPEAFSGGTMTRLPTTNLEHRVKGLWPDFAVEIAGDAPLADSDQPLVRVRFKELAAKAATLGAKIQWDFGDGQSSARPEHVYLHPGVYPVTLSIRGAKRYETTNLVQIAAPVIVAGSKQKPDELADYLPLLAGYDPRGLDGPGLFQLVSAFQQLGQFDKAGAAARAALDSSSSPHDDKILWPLANTCAKLFEDRLRDSQAAFNIWQSAAKRIRHPPWQAECHLQAADVCLNRLLKRTEAKPHLDAATVLCRGDSDNLAGPLNRLWGDWHARGGDRAAARDAYQKAEAARRGRRTPIEQIAWQGSYSRSTEDFLRSDQLDRAWDELLRWQQDFPGDKREGYLPLLLARYWSARKQHEHAITMANDLLCVAPDSPHADQLLYLLAQSEEKLGRIERAQASYRSLASTYPGSPLVTAAQRDVARLEAGRQTK